jgi:hypothetical protein
MRKEELGLQPMFRVGSSSDITSRMGAEEVARLEDGGEYAIFRHGKKTNLSVFLI